MTGVYKNTVIKKLSPKLNNLKQKGIVMVATKKTIMTEAVEVARPAETASIPLPRLLNGIIEVRLCIVNRILR